MWTFPTPKYSLKVVTLKIESNGLSLTQKRAFLASEGPQTGANCHFVVLQPVALLHQLDKFLYWKDRTSLHDLKEQNVGCCMLSVKRKPAM